MTSSTLINFINTWSLLIYAFFFIIAFAVERGNSQTPTTKKRWAVNFLLTVVNILIPLFLAKIQFTGWPTFLTFQLFTYLSLPFFIEVILSFLILNFLAWFTHLLLHWSDFLWIFHQVHHSDTVVDSTTTARFHAVEIITRHFMIFIPAAYIIGIQTWILVSYVLIDSLFNLYIHTNFKLSQKKDLLIGYIFVTPEDHRLHHSSSQSHSLHNFGTILNIWDKLFKTYLKYEGTYEVGVAKINKENAHQIFYLLLWPFGLTRK